MIDLSNNNGSVNFERVHAAHQYRVYLKRSEGATFTDPDFDTFYRNALAADMKVGAYHFARPSQSSPREEADHFLRLLPTLHFGKNLRPCLDLEDPNMKPGPKVAAWAEEWLALVRAHVQFHAIIYGGAYYLGPCDFRRVPAWLWLAAYGRNDGHEYPFAIPKPWTRRQVIAHQYASTARIPGVEGQCDLSHVLRPRLIGLHRIGRR